MTPAVHHCNWPQTSVCWEANKSKAGPVLEEGSSFRVYDHSERTMADRRDATCKSIQQTLIPCRLNKCTICRSNKAPSLALPSFVPLDKCHPLNTVEPSDTVISEGGGS